MMGFDLLLIIGAIAFALGWRPQLGQSGPAERSQSGLEILKARYARGEISREQFEELKRDIG